MKYIALYAIFCFSSLLAESRAGFEGPDTYVVVAFASAELNARAAGLQYARETGEMRFVHECMAPLPAGGGCREALPIDRELSATLKSAKVVESSCEKEKGQSSLMTCRVVLRIERKNLKTLCDEMRRETLPICVR